MPPKPVKRRPAVGERTCPYCGNVFNVRGYGRHEQACRSRHEQEDNPTPVINAEGGSDDEPGDDGTLHAHQGHQRPN